MPEVLFYGGLALMGVSAASGLIALLILRGQKRRLRERLDGEYGPPSPRIIRKGPFKSFLTERGVADGKGHRVYL